MALVWSGHIVHDLAACCCCNPAFALQRMYSTGVLQHVAFGPVGLQQAVHVFIWQYVRV
jgi:hypothetical protein